MHLSSFLLAIDRFTLGSFANMPPTVGRFCRTDDGHFSTRRYRKAFYILSPIFVLRLFLFAVTLQDIKLCAALHAGKRESGARPKREHIIYIFT